MEPNLILAVKKNDIDAIKSALKDGEDIDMACGWPLITACVENNKDAVCFLLEAGADINIDGGAPLNRAALCGHSDIINILLEKNASITDTALGNTALAGHTNIASTLIKNGADVTARNSLFLVWAAERGHKGIVKLFIEHGAKPEDIYKNNNISDEAKNLCKNMITTIEAEKKDDQQNKKQKNLRKFIRKRNSRFSIR